jgi:hypothetical protein
VLVRDDKGVTRFEEAGRAGREGADDVDDDDDHHDHHDHHDHEKAGVMWTAPPVLDRVESANVVHREGCGRLRGRRPGSR